MDLSSLIFVALFVAWAVYLIPMALRRHEEDASSRSVDGFSDRLRVLARRDAVSSTEAELVATGRPEKSSGKSSGKSSARVEEPAAPTPAPRAARPARPVDRPAARRAAARRRRVFNLLLLALVVVAALAIGKVVAWPWLAAPAALMAAWLVACRLMVKRERAARASVRRRRTTLADEAIAAEDEATDQVDEVEETRDDTDEIPVVTAELLDEPGTPDTPAGGWTPVPAPLPTYVTKAPAGRTVRTIDLDSTGVWSSGRNEADSQLAREADAQRAQDAAAADADRRRATGS
ncbi:divisome protein SepX/GlpR [Nocardioides nitrophenolicus]|uniref:divisome protein SepX/GlpR n=1 Tax=Nocardioides nitrophenolicus TaxID=60489 RepID=UPI00195BD44B|nr:hypothetical protein [Nocardioides nitrophenolicus]MBM7518610.1 hypothetical protein [Nocardioides nitrophenolicus]